MVKFKLIVSDPETGKSKNMEVEDASAQILIGKKIGDAIDGAIVKMSGAKLQITGGSDKDGTPLKPSVHGGLRTSIMLSGGIGFHPKQKGERKRKLVRGNIVTEDIFQVNLKILERAKKKPRKRTKKPPKETNIKKSSTKE